jgi:hypothetical protein
LEINEVFENNSSDYGRKLFLIENCIYGVDIQPIAIQISKLRFFISLIIDQKNDAEKPNRGVRPLPNLETKLIAANTLIGLDAQRMLKPNEVHELEKELKQVRHEIFRARTTATKNNRRKRDRKIRREIAELLKQSGFPTDAADKIAAWSPDNQDAHADWFDAEWMFGIEKGFDIVIGNPPYGGKLSADEVEFFRNNYKLKTSETAILFIEKGKSLSKTKGVLSYIIPKSYTFASNYKATREFTLPELALVVDCGKAFENVLLEATVFQLTISAKSAFYRSIMFDNSNFVTISSVNKTLAQKFDFILNGITNAEITIALKMVNFEKYLNNIAQNNRGEMLQKKITPQGEVAVIGGKEIDRFGIRGVKGYVNKRDAETEKANIRQKSLIAQNIRCSDKLL